MRYWESVLTTKKSMLIYKVLSDGVCYTAPVDNVVFLWKEKKMLCKHVVYFES